MKVLRKKAEGGIELKTRSRLADWEEWAEIIFQCMGYQPMKFVNAYRSNRKLKAETALEARPIAQAVIKFMESESKSAAGITKNLDGILGVEW